MRPRRTLPPQPLRRRIKGRWARLPLAVRVGVALFALSAAVVTAHAVAEAQKPPPPPKPCFYASMAHC